MSPSEEPPEEEVAEEEEVFDPPLDEGIMGAVFTLRDGGIETFESCEGGSGHYYPEPMVRFYGASGEGFRALAIAIAADLPIKELRRRWTIDAAEPHGPGWELVFTEQVPRPPVDDAVSD